MTTLPIENVQDYPRPPALEAVPQKLLVKLGSHVVADSNRGYRVLETHHAPTYYLPKHDVVALLTPAPGDSYCEWKGVATYWNVTVSNVTSPRAAWSYAEPSERFVAIAGHIAFYATSKVNCFVGDSEVTPQPGNFYGGWVTDNLQGDIKGAPATKHW